MKVAIFGASGLVGRSLRHFLTTLNIEWVGTYNTSSFPNGYSLEKTDTPSLESFMKDHEITHCINCVAERNVDLCEKQWEAAFETNCLFATRLAEASKQLDIFMVHISTDYVFDGSSPPYLPSSIPCPIQAYGKSKTQAEINIQKILPEACILRVPVLYTQRYTNILETAVTMIGKKVMDTTCLHKEDNYSIRRPVYIDDFALFILHFLKKKSSGLFHFYNPQDRVTKYDIASMIGKFLEKDISHIEAQDNPVNQAGRPYDTHLQDTQYDRSSYLFTTLEKGIQQCFERYRHPLLKKTEKPSEPILFLLDLDGTLVDTDTIHYESYKKAFESHGHVFLSRDEYEQLVSVEIYCKTRLGDDYETVKETKNRFFFETTTVDFILGAESMIQWLLAMEQNFVVVTNTSKQTVQFLQSKLPLLQRITKWITREDVQNPKPNTEPYKIAKERYGKNESFIIGFENTESGYLSLREVTPIIYILCQANSYVYKKLYKNDVYFLRDMTSLLQ
jgi:dTDP-4-dehydrorhamnose reductase